MVPGTPMHQLFLPYFPMPLLGPHPLGARLRVEKGWLMRTINTLQGTWGHFQRGSGLLPGSWAGLCMGQVVPGNPLGTPGPSTRRRGERARMKHRVPYWLFPEAGPLSFTSPFPGRRPTPTPIMLNPALALTLQSREVIHKKVGQFKVTVSTATSTQTIWVAEAFSS